MSQRISGLYGKYVYSTDAEYVGRVEDVILNLEKGEVMSLVLKEIKKTGMADDEVKRILKDDSIPLKDVSCVGDIVIINTPAHSRASRK